MGKERPKKCKWDDPFFRVKIRSASGHKAHSETWMQYAKRKKLGVPKNFKDRF